MTAAATDAGAGLRGTALGNGWTIATGLSALAVSVLLVPVVAAVVAGRWRAVDAHSTAGERPVRSASGTRRPGARPVGHRVGRGRLRRARRLRGTPGGYGESSSARLDEACYDRLVLRVPAAMAIVVAGAVGPGVSLRRRAGTGASEAAGGAGFRSHRVAAIAAVGVCVLAWSAVVVLIVT